MLPAVLKYTMLYFHDFYSIDYTSKDSYFSLLKIEAEDKCFINLFKNDSQRTLAVKTIKKYFFGFGHGRFTSGIWSITH